MLLTWLQTFSLKREHLFIHDLGMTFLYDTASIGSYNVNVYFVVQNKND